MGCNRNFVQIGDTHPNKKFTVVRTILRMHNIFLKIVTPLYSQDDNGEQGPEIRGLHILNEKKFLISNKTPSVI